MKGIVSVWSVIIVITNGIYIVDEAKACLQLAHFLLNAISQRPDRGQHCMAGGILQLWSG